MTKGLRGADREHANYAASNLQRFREAVRDIYDHLRRGNCGLASRAVGRAEAKFGAYDAHIMSLDPATTHKRWRRGVRRPAGESAEPFGERAALDTLHRLRREVDACFCDAEQYRSGKNHGTPVKNKRRPSDADRVCGGRPAGRAPHFGRERTGR